MIGYEGLYYPYIHFRDEGWLKLSALYWDGMYRVVPYGVQLHDSDDVRALMAANFIPTERPQGLEEAVAEINPLFRDLIQRHGRALAIAGFGVEHSDSWPQDPYTARYAPPETSNAKLAYVFGEKMSPQLLSDLFGRGLTATRSDDPRWIGMHPKIASVYMTLLADAMATRLAARPVTSAIRDHVAVGMTADRLAAHLLRNTTPVKTRDRTFRENLVKTLAQSPPGPTDVLETMGSVSLTYAVPASPQSLPVSKIVGFRERYADERRLFQLEIENLVSNLGELGDVRDPAAVERLLKHLYKKTLHAEIKKVEKALRGARIDTVPSALTTSFALPTGVVTALAAIGIGVAPVIAATGGLAFGIWTVWRRYGKAREEALDSSAATYLFRMKRELTPERATSAIRRNRPAYA
jgi:Family of unknown function (DUF6236)